MSEHKASTAVSKFLEKVAELEKKQVMTIPLFLTKVAELEKKQMLTREDGNDCIIQFMEKHCSTVPCPIGTPSDPEEETTQPCATEK